ncbi:MAG: hypothetical protein WC475_01865 [Candidatus Paceibacterota bacterium]
MREATNPNYRKKAESPKFVRVVIWAVVAVLALSLLGRQNRHSVVSDARTICVNAGETIKVKIQPDQWSGWIIGPRYGRFTIDTPSADWFEIFLCTGKRIRVSAYQWKPLGVLPGDRFRIRGTTGEATIAVFVE